MDNRWCNFRKINIRKRQTLRSLGAGCVFFAVLLALTNIFDGSLCPVKRLFGISCFGCGMTRGFKAILEFDFKAAYGYNALSIPLFAGIFVYCLLAIADVVFDKNSIFIIERQLSKKYMYFLYATVLIVSTILNNHG